MFAAEYRTAQRQEASQPSGLTPRASEVRTPLCTQRAFRALGRDIRGAESWRRLDTPTRQLVKGKRQRKE